MTTENNGSAINRAFLLGILLNSGFVAAEIFYGLAADSLSLLADAGHNMSDVLGLLLAWGATLLMRTRPTKRRTYGLRSSTLMAALINALLLMAAVGGISWEAMRRLSHPPPVAEKTVILVAGIGLVINAATALLFLSGRKEDLNIRGAFMHMAGDALVSAGVVVSALVMMRTGWLWLDPAMSLLIAVVIFLGTFGLFRESWNLILHAVPENIDADEVMDYLTSLPGVAGVHDLHIWALSTTENALTAHLVKPDPANDDQVLRQAIEDLDSKFRIHHVTLQSEREES